MTQMDLFPTATSSQPDTHANRSALPEIEEVKKMTDISGQRYLPLLKQSDPLGQFSKTFMVTSLWVSTKCYLIWKGKTTPLGRLLFQLAPLMHPTEETEFGSSQEMWATPNTMDHLPQRSEESTKKLMNGARKGRKRPSNLREQVNPETMKFWRTPDTGQGGTSGLLKQGKTHRENGQPIQVRLVDQVNNPKLWPTPRACTAMSAPNIQNRVDDKNPNLETVVARTILWPTPTANEDAAGTPEGKMQRQLGNHPEVRGTTPEEWKRGSLNPQWVEWLMGYPEGWTDLED